MKMSAPTRFPAVKRCFLPRLAACWALLLPVLPLQAGLWDTAGEYQGWLHFDWFGYWYPLDPYHIHAEHGWQYAVGETPASFYLYDYGLDAWLWTSDYLYPWIYRFGSPNEWAWYYRGASPGKRWFFLPEQADYRREADWRTTAFKAGTGTRHPVATGGGLPARITDPVTGLLIEVPAGQNGELAVAPLLAAPPAPYPGSGYAIETEDLHDLVLEVPPAEPGGESMPIVYAYTRMQGAFDDDTGYAERWTALPFEEGPNGSYRFHLPTPEPVVVASSRAGGRNAAGSIEGERPSNYWVSSINSSMPEWEQHMNVRLQVSAYVQAAANALSASTRSTFESRESARHLTIAYGGNYYTGFNKLRAWSFGRKTRPVLTVGSPLQTQSLAHETGHYLTHLLVGDDAYDSLEKAGGSLFAGNHGIRDSIGRNNLLEDYAYFLEYFLIDTGGNYRLEYPHITFDDLFPITRDFPGIEGFAAHMLAGLRQSGSHMFNYAGTSERIAPLSLPWSRILDIVAQAAQSVDDLRENCEEALVGEEKEAFRILLNRLGWSYKVKGRLVDSKGDPIAGALVRNILKTGGEVYVGGTSNVPSKADGSFVQTSDVFGGQSLLEVTLESGTVLEVPIDVDWTHLTHEQIDLGTLVAAEAVDLVAQTQFDYGNEQAFVKNFTLGFSCDLSVGVLTGQKDAVRVEMIESLDYNTPIVTIRISAPPGTELQVTGPLSVVPSELSGQYELIPGEPVVWALASRQVIAYPAEHFASQTNQSAVLETTVNVHGEGLQAQILFSHSAEFRSDKDAYLGRFGGSFRVQVIGEPAP